jgi:hypothetical protein
MAARGAIHAGRGTSPSMERDTGSHSVDRIVRVILFCRFLQVQHPEPHQEWKAYASWSHVLLVA